MSIAPTVVVGYSDTLPTKTVRLPLKYSNPSQNNRFDPNLAEKGIILSLKDVEGSYLDEVIVTLLKSRKVIELTPLSIDANSVQLSFQSIKIDLPHPVVSPSCLLAQVNIEDQYILLDFIDENFLFISLKVNLIDFVSDAASLSSSSSSSSSSFSLDLFSNWGHISVPYSFELRSAPCFLKATSLNNLVVSLYDGGILHFQRESPLNDYSVFTFNHLPSLLINLFGWGKSSKDTPPTNGVSPSAIIDAVQTSETVLVTLSLDMTLKTWTLDDHNIFGSPIYLSKSDSYPVFLSGDISSKYLLLTGDYLACHYLNNSTPILEVFKVLPTGSIDSSFKLTPNEPNDAKWLIRDFAFQVNNDNTNNDNNNNNNNNNNNSNKASFKLYLLLKSNLLSLVFKYELDSRGKILTTIQQPLDLNPVQDVYERVNKDETYYRDRVLKSGRYDTITLESAVSVLQEHLGLDTRKAPLYQVIVETIGDVQSNWKKFDAVCEEFRATTEECLSISPRDDMIFVLNVHSFSVIREAHKIEQNFALNAPITDILKKVAISFSSKAYTKIYDLICEGKYTAERATLVYNQHLSTKITKSESDALINELVNIPNALEAIEDIIGSIQTTDFQETSENLSRFTKLSSISTFQRIIEIHTSALIGLTVLLLIMEVNDQLLTLLNKIVDKISDYHLLKLIFNTSFDQNTTRGQDNLGNLEFSLFWNLKFVPKSLELHQFSKSFDDLTKGLSDQKNRDDFVIDSVIELINHDEGELLLKSFAGKLDKNNVVERFLIGFVYLINNEPLEFYEIFQGRMDFSVKKKLQSRIGSLTQNDNIREFLSSLFEENFIDPLEEEANYYHSLLILGTSQGRTALKKLAHSLLSFLTAASISSSSTPSVLKDETNFIKSSLKFERKAIAVLKKMSIPPQEQIEDYYYNVFEMAIFLNEYELVFEAVDAIQDDKELKRALSRLIDHLIVNKRVDILFSTSLVKYYLLVDTILLGLANNELILLNSLSYYQYLYSWRLFAGGSITKANELADKRGASEALYIFITRFKHEQNLLTESSDVMPSILSDIKQFKLTILELYMVILNCLKSFDKDEDKWLIKQMNQDTMGVITVEELNQEYLSWVRGLEEFFQN